MEITAGVRFEYLGLSPEIMRAINARRTVLELLLSDHPQDCLTCPKNQDCELRVLAAEFGIQEVTFSGAKNRFEVDDSSEAIMRDLSKCIMCRRCETVCNKVQTVGALTGNGRGFSAKVGTASMIPLAETNCTFCGQCVNVCPVGAISMDSKGAHIDQEKCIKCGKCKSICPYDAISHQVRPCAVACGVNAIKNDKIFLKT